MNQTIHVRILSPQQILLDTEALSVSSKNLKGSFDILPQHANFMTMIENSPIVVRIANQKPVVFKFPTSFLLAIENKVNIYTYAQPPTETKS